MDMKLDQIYAGLALQGLLADPSFDENPIEAARRAWDYSDAMISEEKKRKAV